ncbi:MAG TPA: cell division protein ZapA [Bryobacterales bacterium]|nr:cell division protein ZapA [Bryobacterales bacterium]
MEQEGIRVSIFDQVYYLKSSAADRAHMEDVARYVDQKMAAIASRTQTVDSFRVAVLAALHIADELLRLRQDHDRLQNRVEATSLHYAAMLEEALDPSPQPVATGTDG